MAIWKAQRTLLIVGEGRHEEAFLNYLKQLYVPRGCGLSVTIKNARGKGALHVANGLPGRLPMPITMQLLHCWIRTPIGMRQQKSWRERRKFRCSSLNHALKR